MSIHVDIIYCGAYAYADRVPCEESDPVALLITAEESDEELPTGFISQSQVINQYELTRK